MFRKAPALWYSCYLVFESQKEKPWLGFTKSYGGRTHAKHPAFERRRKDSLMQPTSKFATVFVKELVGLEALRRECLDAAVDVGERLAFCGAKNNPLVFCDRLAEKLAGGNAWFSDNFVSDEYDKQGAELTLQEHCSILGQSSRNDKMKHDVQNLAPPPAFRTSPTAAELTTELMTQLKRSAGKISKKRPVPSPLLPRALDVLIKRTGRVTWDGIMGFCV